MLFVQFGIILCTYYRCLRSYSNQIVVLHLHLIPRFVIPMFVISMFVVSMFVTVIRSYELVTLPFQPPMLWLPAGRNRGRRFNHSRLSNDKVKECLELYLRSITRLYVVMLN